jgi:hypothetical protein
MRLLALFDSCSVRQRSSLFVKQFDIGDVTTSGDTVPMVCWDTTPGQTRLGMSRASAAQFNESTCAFRYYYR